MSALAAEVVTSLATARKAIQLYPPAHPAYAEAIDALVGSAVAASAAGPFVLNWHQGRLYHESVVLPDDLHGSTAIAEAFESRSIESLTFQSSFSSSDAIGLTEVLSLKPTPDFDVEAELASRGVTGVVVSVLVDEEDEERAEKDRQRAADRALYQRLISSLRKVQERFSSGGVGDLADTGALVGNVMERLITDPGAMLGLATIRNTGEHGLFHSLNVTIYTLLLGQKLGLPEEGLSSLGMSALMHDVGKAAFDTNDPAQLEPMRAMHPEVGAEILQRVALEDPAPMLVAFEHHMNADGSGWPERAQDYVTHPYSRMVAIANRFENLTDPDDGTEALTPDKAVVQVLREAGTTLDPFFARLFANALGVFPVGCLVRLSDQTVGVVSRPGDDPLAPAVRVAYDARGAEIDEPEEIDLAEGDVRIVEVIHPDALNVAVADKL